MKTSISVKLSPPFHSQPLVLLSGFGLTSLQGDDAYRWCNLIFFLSRPLACKWHFWGVCMKPLILLHKKFPICFRGDGAEWGNTHFWEVASLCTLLFWICVLKKKKLGFYGVLVSAEDSGLQVLMWQSASTCSNCSPSVWLSTWVLQVLAHVCTALLCH